jgi:transcriptional regulator with XRE-family HTH domain
MFAKRLNCPLFGATQKRPEAAVFKSSRPVKFKLLHAWEQLDDFYKHGLAYAQEMSNRPQTLYDIADSPVGLAAWMIEGSTYALKGILTRLACPQSTDILKFGISFWYALKSILCILACSWGNMVARNQLLTAPPFAVEQALKKFGQNLRVARVRRKQTIEEVAEKIGTGSRAVRDAESGKASTSIAVYTALLWLYDLLRSFEELADPLKDEEGLTFASAKENQRARRSRGLDNDF